MHKLRYNVYCYCNHDQYSDSFQERIENKRHHIDTKTVSDSHY